MRRAQSTSAGRKFGGNGGSHSATASHRRRQPSRALGDGMDTAEPEDCAFRPQRTAEEDVGDGSAKRRRTLPALRGSRRVEARAEGQAQVGSRARVESRKPTARTRRGSPVRTRTRTGRGRSGQGAARAAPPAGRREAPGAGQAQPRRIGQIGQVGQVGQIGQVGRVGQGGQSGQDGQGGHAGQVGQGEAEGARPRRRRRLRDGAEARRGRDPQADRRRGAEGRAARAGDPGRALRDLLRVSSRSSSTS